MTPKDFHAYLHKFGVKHRILPYYLKYDTCEEIEKTVRNPLDIDLREM